MARSWVTVAMLCSHLDTSFADGGEAQAGGGPTPVCIDEYQKSPEILSALKARFDRDGAVPGTAVLSGSTRQNAVPTTAEALTGRLHRLTILPLSQGEIVGTHEDLLGALMDDPDGAVAAHPASATTRDDYISRVCASGFPLALRRSGAARARWFDDYVRMSVERDAVELARIRQRKVLRALLERLAGQTAQVLNVTAAVRGLDADRKTIDTYVRLLEDLFLVHLLPAWCISCLPGARRFARRSPSCPSCTSSTPGSPPVCCAAVRPRWPRSTRRRRPSSATL